ncbi:hypothetical protein LBMAG27_25620 [Bacteroidota bacterium]|nr:hypothetical protein LBMAG27_25620 [Bacteroidota bacterium]
MPIDSVTGMVIYKSIQKIDSASKDELYSRAKVWIATTFNSANDVIQLDDKTNGQIIIKGKYSFKNYNIESFIPLNISIGIKDGKYKIEITEIIYNYFNQLNGINKWETVSIENIYPISNYENGKGWKKIMIEATNKIADECSEIISSFNSAMAKPTIQKPDW